MKILITGAGGFVGSHLTEQLVKSGHHVKILVHYDSSNSWGWIDRLNIKNDIEISFGDVRDFDSVYAAMKNVNTIFHLAALVGIPYSYSSPLAYIKTNIEGTYNVLQSAKLLNTENIVITSTSETYGSAQYIPIDEKHPLVGQSPYAATKIAADNLAISYFRSFNLPIKIVRPFNIYGPRQSARAIIPTIITQLLNNMEVINLGNLDSTRDFTYVLDTVNAFIEISKNSHLNGEIINVGSGSEISISNLYHLIIKLLNKKAQISIDNERLRPKDSEVNRLFCNNQKIKNLTNWELKFNIELGLKETIKWFELNKHLYKHNIFNK
jgi:NAD dependent epimerase/dehydratase